jgi:hypothetical protein
MCFDFLCNAEAFLILGMTERAVVTNVHTSSCEVPVILVGF